MRRCPLFVIQSIIRGKTLCSGKSDLGRRLAQITGGLFFERLLTKYTNPEELFGPLSLSALERDEYVRKVDGYLPTASVAFLDEIFKANSAILNSLLTILNERLFDNGVERRRVPLAAVVGASNELPDSDELEALYDRFLVRRRVSAVSDGAIGELIEASQAAARKAASAGVRGATNLEAVDEMHKHQLSQEGPLLTEVFVDDVKRRAAEVVVPPDVVAILRDTRAFLRDDAEQPVVVSDRRLVKVFPTSYISSHFFYHLTMLTLDDAVEVCRLLVCFALALCAMGAPRCLLWTAFCCSTCCGMSQRTRRASANGSGSA